MAVESTLLVTVPIEGLLPELQRQLAGARHGSEWDEAALNRIVRHEFDFLGPFTHARVESRDEPGERTDFLILTFRAPEGRDLAKAEQTFQSATIRADRGDARGAQAALRALVAAFPEVAKYRRALGQAHLVLGALELAEDEFLRCLALDPHDADALTLLGNLYYQRGDVEKAIPLYERSLALQPNVYALSNLGGSLAKVGRLPDAIGTLQRAVALDPSYPNAWYGLGLALSEQHDPSHLPEAIRAVDRALEVSAGRREAQQVFEGSQSLVVQLSSAKAAHDVDDAHAQLVTALAVEAESEGMPVRLESEPLHGIDAKIEYGWVHQRPYHRIITSPRPSPSREHHAFHELEHLKLANAARHARRNRWFASSPETMEHATRALGKDLGRVAARGLPKEALASYTQSMIGGLVQQLYNFPIDLLIETRLREAHPDLTELFFSSIYQQLELSARIAQDKAMAEMTPKAVFRANTAMNGAFALWFSEEYPHRTTLAGRFQRTDSWGLSKRLLSMWRHDAASWAPGAELDWVDEWASLLGLTGWYRWVDGNPTDASA
jgi:tetratricopeptide (TPR) repeat protein